MFNIIGAMAEFDRELISERVRAGLRNAKAKGKRIGCPSREIDAAIVTRLRSQGVIWRAIASHLGVGLGTLYRVVPGRSKTQETSGTPREGTWLQTPRTTLQTHLCATNGDASYSTAAYHHIAIVRLLRITFDGAH